jgi:hypothetical protein
MLEPKAIRNLHVALAKARERKLEERVSTARLLEQAGSENYRIGVNMMVLFNLLPTNQPQDVPSTRSGTVWRPGRSTRWLMQSGTWILNRSLSPTRGLGRNSAKSGPSQSTPLFLPYRLKGLVIVDPIYPSAIIDPAYHDVVERERRRLP